MTKRYFFAGRYFLFCVAALVLSFGTTSAFGQVDSQQVVPPPATIHPVPQNAGFDVIVKLNGDLVYGLVKEVGPYYISYQRTDIPDGPIYTIPIAEVYVISYRNQVKDYINPAEIGPPVSSVRPYRYIDYKNNELFKNGTVTIGLGFLRSFSKVKSISDYSSSGSFPLISLGYEVNYKSNLNFGLQIGFGNHNFSRQQYSSYDSTQNNITLKENIFGLYLYGRYYVANNSSRLQPYLLAGLGITSSHIRSENEISFTNDNTQKILVKSGSRSTGLGITARVGAAYFVSNQLQVFLDAGAGLSVINAGISITAK